MTVVARLLLVVTLVGSAYQAARAAAPGDHACGEREADNEPCFKDAACAEHVQKGSEFERRGDYAHGIAELRNAVKLRPGPLLQLMLGQLLLKQDPQAARTVLQQIPTAGLCTETAEQLRQALAAVTKTPQPVQPESHRLAPTPTPPIKPRRPVYKRWQLWVGLTGSLAAVGLAVGLGLKFGLPPSEIKLVPDPVFPQ